MNTFMDPFDAEEFGNEYDQEEDEAYLMRLHDHLLHRGEWITKADRGNKKLKNMDNDHLLNAKNRLLRDYGIGRCFNVTKLLDSEIWRRKERDQWNPKNTGIMENYEHLQQETETMSNGINMKNVAALIRDDITTVKVMHDESVKVYTYKCKKDLARTLEVDDQVMVKNANGVTTGEVKGVDKEADIDINGSKVVTAWIFQKVDTSEVEELEKEDRLVEKRIKKMQARSAREQALAALGINQDNTANLLEQIKNEETDDDII